jgi:hypothetical protein
LQSPDFPQSKDKKNTKEKNIFVKNILDVSFKCQRLFAPEIKKNEDSFL